MLLLPQLMRIWLPDYSEATDETCQDTPRQQTPRPQIPPLILFLDGLSAAPEPDDEECKTLPCGHDVSVGSILAKCNLRGDADWSQGLHSFSCAEPDCTATVECPRIPDPRVIDGLAARLDLIQYSWNKDKPTALDLTKVTLLRDILTRIGHVDHDHDHDDPEPEPDADDPSPPSEPRQASLRRTLVQMELEAFPLMVTSRDNPPPRGTGLYCSFRDRTVRTADHAGLRYPMASPGQHCECDVPHEWARAPGSWALSPAETDFDPVEQRQRPNDDDDDDDDDDSNSKEEEEKEEKETKKEKKKKTVRFVAPVVTQVKYFEPWWCAEYRDSGRYWSAGLSQSRDASTEADDEWEVERLEDPEGWEVQVGGAGVVADEDDDDEMFDAMERANESWDDDDDDDGIEVDIMDVLGDLQGSW